MFYLKPTGKAWKSAITYFGNNKSKMTYAKNVKMKLPIGSGVTGSCLQGHRQTTHVRIFDEVER